MVSFREWMNEKEGKETYKDFFNKKLEKYGVKSASELTGEDKKKFFDEVDAEWEGENEEPEIDEKKVCNEAVINDNERNMSSELEVHNGGYGKQGEDSQIIIYINAGTAYRYEVKQTDKLKELGKKSRQELRKYSDEIGKKVEKLISAEIEKLIK